MEIHGDIITVEGSDDKEKWNSSDWRFNTCLSIGAFFLTYILLYHGLALFKWIAENLPLLLPLAVTVLSIFTRATDIRNYESVLKISNDIAIGIISFDIWAISAARSDPSGRVLVNPTTMINGDFVLPFLLAGLLIAVGCVVLTHYRFQDHRTKQRILLLGFVASVVIYIAPFGLTEKVPPAEKPIFATQRFNVVIPYQDPGVSKIAPTFFRDRLFVRIEKDVEAKDLIDAKKNAVNRFNQTTESIQFKNNASERVAIIDGEIIVVPQE